MPYLYPFDPVGNLPSNLIIGEQHVLTPANNVQYHFIVPVNGPFFADSLEVRRTVGGTTTLLQLKTDYLHVYPFIGASRACAKPVYGGIGFTTASLSGIITIRYQTIGGEWVLDEQKLLEVASNVLYNPRTTTWESIVGLPNVFPPVDHEWNLIDMVGQAEIETALYSIEQAILLSGQGDFNYHISNLSNPHAVTKTQVGLGNVPNYSMGTLADVTAGTINKFANPAMIKDYVDLVIDTNVLDKATGAEVITGTDDAKYTTPLAVKTAVDSLISPLQPKLKDQNNNNLEADAKIQRRIVKLNTAGNMVAVPDGGYVQSKLADATGVQLPEETRVLTVNNPNTATLAELLLSTPPNKPVPANILYSKASGNRLQLKSDGLYLGDEAPIELSVIYVDAIDGIDPTPKPAFASDPMWFDNTSKWNTLRGTEAAPFKSIGLAIKAGPKGANKTILLKIWQVHRLTERVACYQNITFGSYGSSPNYCTLDPITGVVTVTDAGLDPNCDMSLLSNVLDNCSIVGGDGGGAGRHITVTPTGGATHSAIFVYRNATGSLTRVHVVKENFDGSIAAVWRYHECTTVDATSQYNAWALANSAPTINLLSSAEAGWGTYIGQGPATYLSDINTYGSNCIVLKTNNFLLFRSIGFIASEMHPTQNDALNFDSYRFDAMFFPENNGAIVYLYNAAYYGRELEYTSWEMPGLLTMPNGPTRTTNSQMFACYGSPQINLSLNYMRGRSQVGAKKALLFGPMTPSVRFSFLGVNKPALVDDTTTRYVAATGAITGWNIKQWVGPVTKSTNPITSMVTELDPSFF